MISYYVAWVTNKVDYGEVSEVFSSRDKASKWAISKMMTEDVAEHGVEGFETMVDADNYRLHGVLPK